MNFDQAQEEIEEMAFAMYCQVRWCRGQVMQDRPEEIARPLFFALQNPVPNTWHFKDLDLDQDEDKFEQFQRIMWDENALGIIEFYDTKTHYIGRLYNFTGIMMTFKSALASALRSYRRHSLEGCQDKIGPKEIKIDKQPIIPDGWLLSSKVLLKEQIGN